MKTVNVKIGTKKEIIEYIRKGRGKNGKPYATTEERLSEKIDELVMQGKNFLVLEVFTEEKCEGGYGYTRNYSTETFILEDFERQYDRLMIQRMEDQEFRNHQLKCWEQIVKMEKDAAKRQGEYFNAMLLTHKLDENLVAKNVRHLANTGIDRIYQEV